MVMLASPEVLRSPNTVVFTVMGMEVRDHCAEDHGGVDMSHHYGVDIIHNGGGMVHEDGYDDLD